MCLYSIYTYIYLNINEISILLLQDNDIKCILCDGFQDWEKYVRISHLRKTSLTHEQCVEYSGGRVLDEIELKD